MLSIHSDRRQSWSHGCDSRHQACCREGVARCRMDRHVLQTFFYCFQTRLSCVSLTSTFVPTSVFCSFLRFDLFWEILKSDASFHGAFSSFAFSPNIFFWKISNLQKRWRKFIVKNHIPTIGFYNERFAIFGWLHICSSIYVFFIHQSILWIFWCLESKLQISSLLNTSAWVSPSSIFVFNQSKIYIQQSWVLLYGVWIYTHNI